jgi:P27 family predicted phage terminase small subunit
MEGMKGRPPTPKHILELRGSWRANEREELGDPLDAPLQPPEWLCERGKAVFANVVAWLMKMGTLSASDEGVVLRYATTYVLWEHAAMKMQAVPEVYIDVIDKHGAVRFARPTSLAMQAKETGEQLRHLETVLGLTPSDRTRLGFKAEKVVLDPMDALLAKRRG